ncbi:hypothetical protein ACTQZK_06325 [Paraeggerthella sp. LCP19S3_G8]|uniref:hypothetical protein n=1 Tax=Paraeggerthella sp. LCP19S3_G8 TaxID=3440248 RepID=UPI002A8F28AF|nr:hypothetical protein [Paraeggerthella sp.]
MTEARTTVKKTASTRKPAAPKSAAKKPAEESAKPEAAEAVEPKAEETAKPETEPGQDAKFAVVALRKFNDKRTGDLRKPGDVFEVTQERFDEILAAGEFVEKQ